MIKAILPILLILFLLYCAGYKRAKAKDDLRKISSQQKGKILEKYGPITGSIIEILSFAGGIYLALLTIVNFLKLYISREAHLWGISFDPLAAIALFLAILQPFASEFLKKYYLR